jgi:site-specific DNA-methyltransferase (adenine-specific)
MANQLFYGDNLEVLREKIDPETVDLCYIDPPFNSKRNYNQIYNRLGEEEDRAQAQAFVDTWEWDDRAAEGIESILLNDGNRFRPQTIELLKGLRAVLGPGAMLAYLVSMTLRIVEIHRVLTPNGNFYLHCDPTASHYLKLVLDSIFCSDALGDFRNEIVWRRTGAHSARRRFGPIHDTIFLYSKGPKFYFNKDLLRPYMNGHVKQRYTEDGNGRHKFTSGGNVLTGSGATGGESGQPWRGFDPSAKNRHWAVPGFLTKQMDPGFKKLSVLKKLDALFAAGLVEITEGSAWPQPVRYLDTDISGQRIQDVWAYQPYTEGTVYDTNAGIDADVQWLGPTDPERLGYETQKPKGLLRRIVDASCPPGGVVMDAYCGCGTTIAVAQDLSRDWIGIDITYRSISLVLNRLEDDFGKDVVDSVQIDGIPKDMQSAIALSQKKDDRLRKEFEKWAVLTYTNNRAIVNERKGADRGLDGMAYFLTSNTDTAKIVFQVKSGNIQRGDISKLVGDMQAEQAELATLITLEEPTKPMRLQARVAERYHHNLTGRDYPRVEIVTIREILEDNRRIELPIGLDRMKAVQRERYAKQLKLPMRANLV